MKNKLSEMHLLHLYTFGMKWCGGYAAELQKQTKWCGGAKSGVVQRSLCHMVHRLSQRLASLTFAPYTPSE